MLMITKLDLYRPKSNFTCPKWYLYRIRLGGIFVISITIWTVLTDVASVVPVYVIRKVVTNIQSQWFAFPPLCDIMNILSVIMIDKCDGKFQIGLFQYVVLFYVYFERILCFHSEDIHSFFFLIRNTCVFKLFHSK